MPQYLLYYSQLQARGKYGAVWAFTVKILSRSERYVFFSFPFGPCSRDLSSVPVLQCCSGANKVN